MDREQINKIYSDYLNDCESEHDMEQIFDLALQAQADEDAISRQDAYKCLEIHGDYDTLNEVYERLQKLPPIKPQYTADEIQKMQDLEQAEIQKAYELGKAEAQKWIPVEWKHFGKCGYPKPEDEYKHFLTIDDKGEITIQEFLLSLDEEPQPYFTGMRKIIAWMSLPKPYEPQESEEV